LLISGSVIKEIDPGHSSFKICSNQLKSHKGKTAARFWTVV